MGGIFTDIRKVLYKIQRALISLYTYDCAHCKEYVRGTCLCEKCKKELVPADNKGEPYFAYYYTGPARSVMLCFKFSDNPYYCLDTLFDWLSEAYEKIDDKNFDFVISVPSYKEKEPPIAEIVDKFSYMHDLPFRPKYLQKIKETKKQHKLSSEERNTNLLGSFAASPEVKGKKILLIDDVMTTGNTVNECKKTLLNAGAEKVTVITILKTNYNDY